MNHITSFLTENINTIYYTLAVIGLLYATYKFFYKIIQTTNMYNLFRLIKETPELVVSIKDTQKEILQEIRLHGKLVNAILDTLELAQFVCDSEGKCIKVNSKWISLTGLSEEEASGHHWLLSIHSEDRQNIQKKWYNMIAYNTPFEEVFRYQHRVTDIITKVKCTATDVTDEEGKRIFILGLSRVL